MRFDAVVLAGGRAARLGGVPKPGIVVAGTSLLDRALAATRDAGRTVVVGPPGTLPGDAAPSVRLTREDPPFGGPVAGIDAGLRALAATAPPSDAPAPDVVVLAVDVPRASAAVPRLLDALDRSDDAEAAWLVREGRPQWLVGAYRRAALVRALDAVRDGGSVHDAPVGRLVAGLSCVVVPDDAGLSDDVDTWEDVVRMEDLAGLDVREGTP
jgi:molybdopterin-guanine dinucleotide biosynthesis protein A